MRVGAVLTDLDGTLLEPDGTLLEEVRDFLGRLAADGIPVCAVTSKTAGEIAGIRTAAGLATPAGFENGAGVLHADGAVELLAAAVATARLQAILERLRRRTGAPVSSIREMSDREIGSMTGLAPEQAALARHRRASLPLVVDPEWDEPLRRALPSSPRLQLLRGNRFLHLQGFHDKADVVPRLLELVGAPEGAVVVLGDAPNDRRLVAAGDVGIIVPGEAGPHPELVEAVPTATVAPMPHGRGWVAAVAAVLAR